MANILLIEDELLVARTIQLMLMKAGHAVTIAHDGDVGLQRFDDAPTDLVITDIVMPRKEGNATIRELRQRSRRVPIIAISGGGRAKTVDFLRVAHASGATEVLHKPFANAELIGLVRKCLNITET